jgi:glycosyltransferase involved in cell wall biosynthesis
MSDQHSYRATILPVIEGVNRPLWSVMIPTYNCAEYLRETLASVLAQDPGSDVMQIEVVDDYSTKDDPEAVVQELGQGRVSFYRQPQNVGYIKNFETCLQRSRGKLIHLLHSDDHVRDGFYHKMQTAFENHPEIGAAFCRHICMDERGNWNYISALIETESCVLSNWLERIAVKNYLQTPTIVVRREVYEKLGGFDRRIKSWGEDWEMWVRIAANYPVWFEIEPLAVYRDNRLGSLTNQSMRTGKNVQDIRLAAEICKSYLPQSKARKLSRQAREFWAIYALGDSEKLLSIGDLSGALAQIREALRCRLSFRVIKRLIRVFI